MLFLGAFFTFTNYAAMVQVVVTPATLTTLVEYYGQHSFILYSNSMAISSVNDVIHHFVMLLTDGAFFGKLATFLVAYDG